MRPLPIVKPLVVIAVMAFASACNALMYSDFCTTNDDCVGHDVGPVCHPESRICVTMIPDAGTVAAPTVVRDDSTGGSPAAACDPAAPFTDLAPVKGLEATYVTAARFDPSERTLLYSGLQGCADEPCTDILRATRERADAPLVPRGVLPGINAPDIADYWPTMTADGLLLFFESARAVSGVERSRIWTATRTTQVGEFSEPRVQTLFRIEPPGDGSWAGEAAPYLHPNGKSLYFVSDLRGGKGHLDLFVATLGDFGTASAITNLDALNSPAPEHTPVVTRDDDVLYFAREDAAAVRHVYRSRRPLPGGAFGAPSIVAELGGEWDTFPDWISDDQCRLYVSTNRPLTRGGPAAPYRLWVATRRPR